MVTFTGGDTLAGVDTSTDVRAVTAALTVSVVRAVTDGDTSEGEVERGALPEWLCVTREAAQHSGQPMLLEVTWKSVAAGMEEAPTAWIGARGRW